MTRRDFTKGLFAAGLAAGLPVIGRADEAPSAAAVRAGARPSRSLDPFAIGVISWISIRMLSPGMTISTPSGSVIVPVTSVVLK